MSGKQLSEEQMERYFSKEKSRVVPILLFILGFIAVAVSFTNRNLLALALVGVVLFLIGGLNFAVVYRSRPTDAEYDQWLEDQVNEMIESAMKKLRLDRTQIPGRPLIAKSAILPTLQNLDRYPKDQIRIKDGKDGVSRYSINVFTFFFPALHHLAVFTVEINALNQGAHQHSTTEYFYRDIVGVTTKNIQDTIKLENQDYQYLIETFSLEIVHGGTIGIGASFNARPIDRKQKTAFTISGSDVDQTVAQLRSLIRGKKLGSV